MKRSAVLAFALTGALAIAASPAAAQHRRGGGENGGDGGNAAPRGEQRSERQAQPRQQAQPQQQQQQAAPPQRVERGPERRAEPRQAQPSVEQRAIPREQYRGNAGEPYRGGQYRGQQYRGEQYRGDNRAVPRTYAAPRYVGPRNNYSAPRYYSGRYYGPRYAGPRFSVAPRAFYRPYYVFRPRFSIGFGIWAGYPITYYDPFYYPYNYYSYSSPYYSTAPVPVGPGGSVAVQPDAANMGGVSFEISPSSAEIWVDGTYYGTVDQFTPSSQPLGLPAGRHHIELREPGFQVSAFDVDVIAGQVIPFQGQLEP